MNNILLEFELNASKATTTHQLNQVLEHYLKSLNIDTFAYTYYSKQPTSLNKLKYEHCSKNFELWHKHYINEHYEDIDTTLDITHQSIKPICWDLETQLKTAKTPRERKMRMDAIHFGVEKGISIPIHGPSEDFAILMVAQRTHQTCLEPLLQQPFELFTVAYYFYDYMKSILVKSQPPEEKYQLSSREMQCLSLIAKQFSLSAIADYLKITERTVNYHIQRLNKRLGTKNKHQAVIKALQLGLIKL